MKTIIALFFLFPAAMSLRVGLQESYQTVFKPTKKTVQEIIDQFDKTLLDDMSRISDIPFSYTNGIELRKSSPGLSREPWQACVQLLLWNLTDICPIILSVTSERLDKIDFLSPYLRDEKHTALIYKDGDRVDEVNTLAVVKVFGLKVWMILGCFLVSIPILLSVRKVLVERADFYSSLLGYMEVLIGALFLQGREGEFVIVPDSLYLLPIWSLSAVVIAQIFSGTITSITALTHPYNPPFYDLPTAYAAGYKIFPIGSLYNKSITTLLSTNVLLHHNELRLVLWNSNVDEGVEIGSSIRKGTLRSKFPKPKLIIPRTTTWYTEATCEEYEFQLPLKMTTSGNCLDWPNDFMFPFGSYGLRKNLSEKPKLTEAVTQLHSVGLVRAYYQRLFPKKALAESVKRACKDREKRRMRVIPYGDYSSNLRENASLFVVWGGCLAMGAGVFLMEILFKKVRREKVKTRRGLSRETEFLRVCESIKLQMLMFPELDYIVDKERLDAILRIPQLEH